MKTIYLYLILIFISINSQAELSVPIETQCTSGCNDVQSEATEGQARETLESNVVLKADIIEKQQIKICGDAQSEHTKWCNVEDIETINREANEAKDQLSSATETHRMMRHDPEALDESSISQIIGKLETASNLLGQKKIELDDRLEACQKLKKRFDLLCKNPILEPGDVRPVTSFSENTTAKAQMTDSITIESMGVHFAQSAAETTNEETLSAARPVRIDIIASKTQADYLIENLKALLPTQDNSAEQFSGANCNPLVGSCPTTEGIAPDQITTTTLPPMAAVSATDRTARAGSGSDAGTAGSGGGATAEEVMSSAQDSAYGGSPTVNVNTTNTGSAAPQGGGAGGGFAGALSGLSSMLGKATGGAFGDSSSYSNNYGSSRYGSNARTNNGGSYPTESYDYNSANQKTANGGVQQPRGFQPQAGGLPSNAGFNPNAGAQGGSAGSGLSGSSSSGSGGPNADKPSLFSRLFGKKDKTLFSNKSSGGGGGGSFGGASSKTGYSPTGASLDSNGLQDPSNPNGGRSFDPSKYMPSKAAEERAYLRSTGRSTGRKIASHSLGDGSANGFQWPNDISKNKNMNLFKTVNIIHRAKLSQ